MSTTPRTDPLAFLDDEVAALKERHLYRALRVMSSAQGPIVSVDDRRLISLSSNDYLGLTHHPRLKAAALEAVREFGVGSGAVRTIAGTMSMHEALEAELADVQGHAGGPHLPVRLHGQHRGDPDDHRRDGPDRVRRPQPRQHHRRDAPVQGAAQDLPARRRRRPAGGPRRGRGARPRRVRRAVSPDPGRHRRRVQHGRRHRAAAGDRGRGRGVRRRRVRGRRPRQRASWAARVAAASITSACTAGSRSRSARCPRRSGRSAATWPGARRCARS